MSEATVNRQKNGTRFSLSTSCMLRCNVWTHKGHTYSNMVCVLALCRERLTRSWPHARPSLERLSGRAALPAPALLRAPAAPACGHVPPSSPFHAQHMPGARWHTFACTGCVHACITWPVQHSAAQQASKQTNKHSTRHTVELVVFACLLLTGALHRQSCCTTLAVVQLNIVCLCISVCGVAAQPMKARSFIHSHRGTACNTQGRNACGCRWA